MSAPSRLALYTLMLLGTAAPAEELPRGFVTREGGRLIDGGRELRFVSWNIPNLLVLEDAFEFLGESPWRWPDEYEIADALESAKQMGGSVVRSYVITVRREGSDMGDHVHVLAPGEFNERAFETLDLVLKIANEKGVRVILPLVDNWKWMGGVAQYAAFRGKPAETFWTDPQLIDDFKQTVRHIVTRRNTLTGVAYRDDPAILCWETGNELDSPPEWTAEIAAYIKRLDPNHLVLDGRSLKGFPHAALDDPNIDLISTHHYPNSGNNDARSIVSYAALASGKKPYFVGEFGFVPIDEAERMLDAVIEERLCGALYWSLRFRRREGGFYWHHEPSGGDLFKAYHWPGFPEGREYREHLVLPLLRDKAFRIRGLDAPPPPRPAPPVLLPIESPTEISWRGSTGAASNRVLRATSKDGPWEVIADAVSDASVQYRPLFCDASARTGTRYYYRVIAINAAGDSAPSNTVGPIVFSHRALVDELADTSLLAETTGEISLRTNEARKVQEDIHRLELAPGSGVTYRVDGPLASAKIFLFSADPEATLSVSAVTQDRSARPIEVIRSVSGRTAGDYGYLTPVLLEADLTGLGARMIRLDLIPGAPSEAQLSRIELLYDAP